MKNHSILCIILLLIATVLASPAYPALEKAPTMNELGWRFAYDDADRIVKVTDPAGRDTRFEYRFDGKTKRLLGQVRTAADGTRVSYDLDGDGRVVRMTDAAGSVAYGYDNRGLLTKVQREGGPAIAYSYDTQGRMIGRQVGDFFRLGYGYDFLGRLAFMDTPAGRVEYAYETGQGIVVRTLPNGVKTLTTYTPNGQLSEITHGYFPDPRGTSYELLAEYRYSYRPDGLIKDVAEGTPSGNHTTTYDYDTSGRLVRAAAPGGRAYSYTYDPVGNRLKADSPGQPSQIATYDWAGRLTSLNGSPTAHDAAGNLTSVTLGAEPMSYAYNADSQLAGAGNGRVGYRYDGEGRLIARTVERAETRFTPDPLSSYWQPLVMQGPDGRRTLVVWEGDKPLMLIEDGRAQFLLHDHLGSVRLVADAKGQVKQRFDYDPFGTPIDSASAKDFAPRFAGLFWDTEGFYLTLDRGYRADLGRFLQTDPHKSVPAAYQNALPTYFYADEDPVNLVDRNGADSSRANAELEDMEQRVRDLIDREVRFNFPNQDVPGYLKCWQWQDLVYDALTRNGKQYQEWNIVPYAERGGFIDRLKYAISTNDYSVFLERDQDFLKHFFVVAESKSTPGAAYKIDPWRRNPIRYEFGTPADYRSGKAAKPMPFAPDPRRYVLGVFGNPTRDIASTQTTRANPQPASVTWHGAVVRVLSQRATPEEIAAYKAAGRYVSADGSTGSESRLPSRVGGVYLGGAGQSLEGIGLLDGIAQDANGNLVLTGKSGGEIKLPPLRLDDVVTVFRSVYLDGEGPTVTIDPDPKNPQGPTMNVINSKSTEGTYVGWVLFQADRLMKGYNLGEDNETHQAVASDVPGYASVLDSIYYGGGHAGAAGKGGSWERFWIVPASARRFAAKPQALTVLDVPLKVRTQPMKWDMGKLVDDPKRPASKGAAAFSDWFTANYDGIAKERFLTPPPESGLTEPVPVFTELRRIALLTAIAEQLRDQGVPLPFWMRDYPVKPVPFDPTTPSLEVLRSKGNLEVRILGGVNLVPPTAEVKSIATSDAINSLPKPERAAARADLDRSVALTAAVQAQMPVPEPLAVQRLTGQGAGYQALALPGADTQALAPATLEETDLAVPIAGGEEIRLTRRYNSFFDPIDTWGRGWTLDLPRLSEVKIPESRTAQGQVRYRSAFELITPLNTRYARFSKVAPVPELGGSKLLVPERPGDFLGLAEAKPDFLTVPTRVAIAKDGERWHFAETGDLVATERNGYRTLYERDATRRITRIVGLQGKVLAATIELIYDPASGHLQSATGQRQTDQAPRPGDALTVRYAYDAQDRLAGVQGHQGRTGYRYEGTRVAAVTYQGAPATKGGPAPEEVTVRRFEYDPRGQLLAETDAGGARTAYHVVADATGRTITTMQPGPEARTDRVRYDPAFRPIEAQYADGSKASWTYPKDGGTALVLAQADGGKITLTEKADLSERALVLDQDRRLVGNYDTAGRLTSLTDNGSLALRQEWSPDGRLTLAANETTALHPDYDAEGLVTRVLVAPPSEKGQFKHWQETKLDATGRPREITDYRGLKVAMGYDGSGDLIAMATERDGNNYGYQLTRDASGRIQEVTSSWGQQHYRYDDTGRIQRVDMKDGDATAQIEWQAGQLARVRQFDGGTLAIDYYQKGPQAGLPAKITTPNALELKYEYDTSQRLASVAVGDQSRLALGYDAKGRVAAWTYTPARP